MSDKTPFQKPFANAHELILLLQSRGLIISEPIKAERYLDFIGYYRLSAYMYPLLQLPKEQHRYKPNTTFSHIMMLYRFDKKLRLLLFNEIEKIEIAVRSSIVNTGCKLLGDSFWITNGDHFINENKFNHTLDLIDSEMHKSREDFIVHFRQTYSNKYPPVWILAEILPFGVITNIFSNIKSAKVKKCIANKFGLQISPFESWLTIITLTRNACCHHARVWNKQNTIKPMLPNKTSGQWISLPTDTLRIYFNICIIKYFINTISPQNDMKTKLDSLLSSFPNVDIKAMGFPQGWNDEPLWKETSILGSNLPQKSTKFFEVKKFDLKNRFKSFINSQFRFRSIFKVNKKTLK